MSKTRILWACLGSSIIGLFIYHQYRISDYAALISEKEKQISFSVSKKDAYVAQLNRDILDQNNRIADLQKELEITKQSLRLYYKYLKSDMERAPLWKVNGAYERAEYVVDLRVSTTRYIPVPHGVPMKVPHQRGLLSGSVIKYILAGEEKFLVLTAGHIQDENEILNDVVVHFRPSLNLPSEEAEMLTYDHTLDLAALKFKKGDFKFPGRTPRIISSEYAPPCSWVMAVGSPLSARFTPSIGIVANSGLSSDERARQKYKQPQVLIHHALINPGSSGGPLILFGMEDEPLVGVNIMCNKVDTVTSHIYVAVPGEDVLEFLSKVVDDHRMGEIRHATMGLIFVDSSDLDKLDYSELHLDAPKSDGIMVIDVKAESDAQKAGVHAGDIIETLNGEKYKNALELIRKILYEYEPGSMVKINMRRGDERIEISFPLAVLINR